MTPTNERHGEHEQIKHQIGIVTHPTDHCVGEVDIHTKDNLEFYKPSESHQDVCEDVVDINAVSYTHLTLPTIYSV